MTNELNKLIEEYINKELPNLNLQHLNSPLQIWGHHVFDPTTKIRSVIKGI